MDSFKDFYHLLMEGRPAKIKQPIETLAQQASQALQANPNMFGSPEIVKLTNRIQQIIRTTNSIEARSQQLKAFHVLNKFPNLMPMYISKFCEAQFPEILMLAILSPYFNQYCEQRLENRAVGGLSRSKLMSRETQKFYMEFGKKRLIGGTMFTKENPIHFTADEIQILFDTWAIPNCFVSLTFDDGQNSYIQGSIDQRILPRDEFKAFGVRVKDFNNEISVFKGDEILSGQITGIPGCNFDLFFVKDQRRANMTWQSRRYRGRRRL